MKILIHSYFWPSSGGIESVMLTLTQQWSTLGCKIIVNTPHTNNSNSITHIPFPFQAHYKPSLLRTIRSIQWCQLYIHASLSLKALWPLLLHRNKLVIIHHTWHRRNDGSLGWQNRTKRFVSRFALNIAPSKAVADDLGIPCHIIPNPYDANLFHNRADEPRTIELIFVGRLVSDKGVDLLLRAVGCLKDKDLQAKLTIIGDGPERVSLMLLTQELRLDEQVAFLGMLSPSEIACHLRRHEILVVPSRWREPFGVVALEGIACGCVVVGSDQGGLPEAIGPCGLTFPNGDIKQLALQIERLLKKPDLKQTLRVTADEHLIKHHPTTVAKQYLELFETVLKNA